VPICIGESRLSRNSPIDRAGRLVPICIGKSRLLAGLALALVLGGCSVPHGVLVPSPNAAPSAGTIDAFVPQAVRFVEASRGLKFKHPVRVRHLSDRAFGDRVIELQRESHADLERQAKVLRALGLLAPDVDAERAEEELLATGVVGFYDSRTKELEVRGDTATVSVRHVVVHELTHALQDQWFSLDYTGTGNDDADIAYTTLVEGDAVRVETAYVASLSPGDRRRLRAEESRQGSSPPTDVPRVLVELLSFPYADGPSFTRAVLQARGQKGLDDAFTHRPASSSQVLHPDRFLAGDAPAAVAEPSADGPAFDHGTIGELGLDLLLEDLVRSGGLSAAQLRSATDGWAGDRYVAWPQGSGYCVRDRLVTSGSDANAALTTALRQLAASRPGVTIDAGEQSVLTSCG
jgi:hypothetical protein